jgi:hypothetical protein
LTDGKADPLMAGNFVLKLPGSATGVTSEQASAELHTLAHQFAAGKRSSFYQLGLISFRLPTEESSAMSLP